MTERFDNPIIIIGTGGSGSSLLGQMLGAHKKIYMLGEFKFLIPQIWSAMDGADASRNLENIAPYLENNPKLSTKILKSPVEHQKLLARMERESTHRKAVCVRNFIREWFKLDADVKSHWGLKEICNGSAWQSTSWDLYDVIFPRAIWLHIIRHPVSYIWSYARLSGTTVSTDTAAAAVQDWIGIQQRSAERAATGRYHRIRYEDLCHDPERVLGPVLKAVGQSWSEECRAPLAQQWGERSDRPRLDPQTLAHLAMDKALQDLAEMYGYSLSDQNPPAGAAEQSMRLGPDGRYILPQPVQHEIGACWQIDLTQVRNAISFAGLSDDVGEWTRSMLRLFENDREIGPAHALHETIRTHGAGAYSHWQGHLKFSTSDNSNPNSNGRCYSFDLQLS